jgi:hypothetical protein
MNFKGLFGSAAKSAGYGKPVLKPGILREVDDIRTAAKYSGLAKPDAHQAHFIQGMNADIKRGIKSGSPAPRTMTERFQSAKETGQGIYNSAKTGLDITNVFSESILGASVQQIAGVGIVGLGALSLFPNQPEGAIEKGSQLLQSFGEQAAMSSRPTYGMSAINQSTQGLVFGLNSRRTAR